MEALAKILDRLETSQNQILDGMVNQENSEHLVALQLNLARGIAEIKLLATQPSKPIQLYPQNALLFDNNQPIIFIFHLTKRFAGKNRSAVYAAWNLDHILNSAEANIIIKKLKNQYICNCSYNFTVPLTIPQNISNTYSMIKKEADSKLSSLLS